jgi:hypothetical protein
VRCRSREPGSGLAQPCPAPKRPCGTAYVRLQGASGPSPGVAGRGSICRLAAVIVAGDSLTSPGFCLRWLPVWLPDPDDAASRGKRGVARRIAPRALAVAAPVGSELSDTRITDRDGRAEARRAISADLRGQRVVQYLPNAAQNWAFCSWRRCARRAGSCAGVHVQSVAVIVDASHQLVQVAEAEHEQGAVLAGRAAR